ncbi:MAG TPA: high-potential iron-sulfur protein [Sandaracinaceae bacterium]
MSDGKMGRREAAKRALMVLGAAVIAPSALAGCGSKEEEGGFSCQNTSGLSPAELSTRQSQAYTDSSPHADKRCDNCRFFQAGQPNACGTCQVIRGPIHPQGYCNLWAAQG